MKAITGIILVVSASCLWAQTEELGKPNIILILADDLGYGDLGYTGSTQIRTPHIDALATSGVQFIQGYVSSAVCAPSRAGLLTGRNQVEFGFDNNLAETQPGFDPAFAGLPVGQMTIADRLKAQGYATGLIGKWHLGDKEQFHPTKRGFDEFWGYLGGSHDYFQSVPNGKGALSPIQSNYKTPKPLTYITDDQGDECVDFIKRHAKEPFFLYASFNAPHAPMQATQEDLALFSHIADQSRRTYAAMVHRLDVNVGKIIRALEAEGLRENTLVVFLSDNGGPADQNASLNAPLNGQKGILLEGGIRVPFIFSWPAKLPTITFDWPVSALDLAPTFLQMAGGEVAEVDFSGVDLMPFLLDEKLNEPHTALMWKFTISSAIREGDWKLISIPDRLPMLFHLPNDRSEQHDVALANLAITEKLLKKLGQWSVRLPHPVFMEGAEWKRKQLELYNKNYALEQPKAKTQSN